MNAFARIAATALVALASAAAWAGGPLSVCNSTPVKYPGAGTVNLAYDQGNLGTRTKAQADAIVTSAVALWTNVSTATVTIGRAADLPVDVTTANYTSYYQNFSDGINPVIYDTDGSLTDLLLGTGAKNSVLGFAGSAYNGATCAYVEGQAFINGFIGVSDAVMTVVMAHEIGHLIGMDHTQLDASQGLASANFPLMYPIAYRTTVSLGDDDASAVSALYPDSTLNTVYGQITGNLVRADGVTPVLGANIWARETTTGKVYSVVSDYLSQGNGAFKMLLPAGTYDLHVEAIDPSFTGGSSVGPYSEDSTGFSFQAPLYSGVTPMAPVTLGNAAPTTFAVNPGCAATLTFRLDGTGGAIGGNCGPAGPAPATMVSPAPGSTLPGTSQTFTWTNTGATLYQLWVGNAPGTFDIAALPAGGGTGTSATVTGLPTDGRTLYVRVYSQIAGVWQPRDYTYKAFTAPVAAPAALATPAPGSTLTGSSQTFTWNNVGALAYQLWVGNTPGADDIGFFPSVSTSTATSVTVPGLPTDGRTLYMRLWSNMAGVWQARDYTYRAFTAVAAVPASMVSPTPGSTLTGSTGTFTWSNTGALAYQVWVGTTPGNHELGFFPASSTSTATSAVVTGLPTDGSTLYVRLWTNVAGAWQARDYTYTAFSSVVAVPASMLSPTPGSTLVGSTQTFTWSNTGALAYQVWMSTTPGNHDLGFFPTSSTSTATSATVSGLPTNGSTLYVRLWTNVAGVWQARDYTYTTSGAITPTPATLSSPTPGSTLSGSTQSFTWNNSGASLYQVWVGNSFGTFDIGAFPAGGTTATSAVATGLPTDGRTLYVRLYSQINGVWQPRDYTYRSGP